ncbi:Sodium/potassium/calcium exchanger 2 [Halotydeus destructor]|nr:Sodium/potassium/calcium exchanger 2 [Halotydeus destructor]
MTCSKTVPMACGSGHFRSGRRKLQRLATIVPAGVVFLLVVYITKGHQGLTSGPQAGDTWSSRTLLDNMADKVDPNLTVEADKGANFPPDLFTAAQRKQGAIVCHIFGLLYMFVALAIVCDEFFIPALDVITAKMGISEDVAGATFMAAGGSAPELFTSIIGVFISQDDVGIGTIVGSAVFNILFVISMCAIFSRTVLVLTWWPLFRDVTFYAVILISLMYCFKDSHIHWYESLFLLSWYGGYVAFMSFNETIEKGVKRLLNRSKVNGMTTEPVNGAATLPPGRRASMPMLHGGGSKFRQGVLQLMIHSVDPLHHEILQAQQNGTLVGVPLNAGNPGSRPTSSAGKGGPVAEHTHPPGATECALCASAATDAMADTPFNDTESNNNPDVNKLPHGLPIAQEKRKFFAGSFLGSILWIAFFSYLMVWWATLVGETFDIASEVMGLTFLAAGTSIPDLITSVLVARKGLGDMAVSSSVGSNIFDVTVGLPFPWFLYSLVYGVVKVNSTGMACSILLLFLMLLFVIITIAAFKWRLNVGMAIVMFLLYFVFLYISLKFEKKSWKCSDIIGVM